MTEKITLRIFIGAMLTTASLAIVAVWGEHVLPEEFFKAVFTSFVIGLASFILWVFSIFYRLIGPVLAALKGVAGE